MHWSNYGRRAAVGLRARSSRRRFRAAWGSPIGGRVNANRRQGCVQGTCGMVTGRSNPRLRRHGALGDGGPRTRLWPGWPCQQTARCKAACSHEWPDGCLGYSTARSSCNRAKGKWRAPARAVEGAHDEHSQTGTADEGIHGWSMTGAAQKGSVQRRGQQGAGAVRVLVQRAAVTRQGWRRTEAEGHPGGGD